MIILNNYAIYLFILPFIYLLLIQFILCCNKFMLAIHLNILCNFYMCNKCIIRFI